MGHTMTHYLGSDAGLLHLGERVAAWLRHQRLTAKEVAVAAALDVRTARTVLEGSCGVRALDALAKVYGWEFIEAVMTPAVGADPLTARERDLARRQAEAAALHARIERERAVRAGTLVSEDHRAVRSLDGEARVFAAAPGGEG